MELLLDFDVDAEKLFCNKLTSLMCSSRTYILIFFIVRHETILSVLRCIEALVQCFSKRRHEFSNVVADSINLILKQIWMSSLRVIGVKHLTDCGFSLLTTLLKVFTMYYEGLCLEGAVPVTFYRLTQLLSFWALYFPCTLSGSQQSFYLDFVMCLVPSCL